MFSVLLDKTIQMHTWSTCKQGDGIRTVRDRCRTSPIRQMTDKHNSMGKANKHTQSTKESQNNKYHATSSHLSDPKSPLSILLSVCNTALSLSLETLAIRLAKSVGYSRGDWDVDIKGAKERRRGEMKGIRAWCHECSWWRSWSPCGALSHQTPSEKEGQTTMGRMKSYTGSHKLNS